MVKNSESIRLAKKLLRSQITQVRSQLSEEERERKSQLICNKAISLLHPIFNNSTSARVLFTYIPFGSEVNILPIIEWCWQQEINVVVPKAMISIRELQLHYLTNLHDLEEAGPWGIREPKADAPRLLDLSQIRCILMPGVAFDVHKARLGYGGGYYDRFLQKFTTGDDNLPFKLALAFDLQIVPKVPCEEHDLCVDKIVTETRQLD